MAKLEYAPLHGAKEHIVKYNPEKDFVDHMFVHEMMHLKMNQQATLAGKGKAVISSESTRSAFDRRFLRFMQKTHKQLSSSAIRDIMDHTIKPTADMKYLGQYLINNKMQKIL